MALHVAVRTENVEMVKILLAYGMDPNAKDVCENTPVNVAISGAAQHGNIERIIEIITLLGKSDAKMNQYYCRRAKYYGLSSKTQYGSF